MDAFVKTDFIESGSENTRKRVVLRYTEYISLIKGDSTLSFARGFYGDVKASIFRITERAVAEEEIQVLKDGTDVQEFQFCTMNVNKRTKQMEEKDCETLIDECLKTGWVMVRRW